jgi:hypothetical protein
MRKWIKIKPAIRIDFIPAKMHNIQPAFTSWHKMEQKEKVMVKASCSDLNP